MKFGNEFTGCYLYLLSYVKNELLEKLFQRVSLTTNINNKLNLLYFLFIYFFLLFSVCIWQWCGVWLPLGVKGCKRVRGHPHTLKGNPKPYKRFRRIKSFQLIGMEEE